MAKENVFKDFTNLYELSKTLRFELKPIGNTQKMLEDNKVFEKDKTRADAYKATKPFLDKLHREFINEALKGADISGLSDYPEFFKEWKKDKKSPIIKKQLEQKESALRNEIKVFFDGQGKIWAEDYANLGLKQKDYEMLFEEGVFKLLKEKNGKEEGVEISDEKGEMISIFDGWKGFTGYFVKFQETRRNFYKTDGKVGRISTRIIDQNLRRFADNLDIFEKLKDKLDFSEVEGFFGKKMAEVFNIGFYNKCLLQNGIDFYNDVLGGKTLENGEKKKGINELVNQYRQTHKVEKLPFLKSLDKQILSEKEKFIDEIENEDEFLVVLKDFYNRSDEKINVLEELINHFTGNIEDYELDKIYISKEAFNTISRKWTSDTGNFESALFNAMKKGKENVSKKEDEGFKFPDFIALDYISKPYIKFLLL